MLGTLGSRTCLVSVTTMVCREACASLMGGTWSVTRTSSKQCRRSVRSSHFRSLLPVPTLTWRSLSGWGLGRAKLRIRLPLTLTLAPTPARPCFAPGTQPGPQTLTATVTLTPGIATEMRDSSRMHLLLDSDASWVGSPAGRLASTPANSDADGRQDTEASATAEVSAQRPTFLADQDLKP
jgi:hypothetical protein